MNIESNVPKNKEVEIENAKMTIMVIREHVIKMWANGYEPSAFDQILKDLESGSIKPQEAIKMAYKIEKNK